MTGYFFIFLVFSILAALRLRWLVKDVHRSIQPGVFTKEIEPPTKLGKLIEQYMKQDPLDSSSTINFLMEVDGLEDPFAEASAPVIQPPPKPSDAATSAKPPWAPKREYNIKDDLDRAYAVPPYIIGNEWELRREKRQLRNIPCHRLFKQQGVARDGQGMEEL